MSLTDKNGVTLERGMRVTTKEGLKAHVTRLDEKSQRAVVIFDEVDGVVPVQPTMRRVNTLAVRKVAGKVLFAKEAVKAAKAPAAKPAPAKPAKPAKAKDKPAKGAAARAKGKDKPAPVEQPEPAVEAEPLEPAVVAIADTEAVEVEDLDALLAGLPVEALEV